MMKQTPQQLTGNDNNVLDLSEFGSAIVEKSVGEEIYHRVLAMLAANEIITIDLGKIITMATYCAKQIFGRLYIDLGSDVFFQRIVLANANKDLKYIVTTGIKNALHEQ
ncbi:STAS-like domain-containing protein [Hymenobacter agri]